MPPVPKPTSRPPAFISRSDKLNTNYHVFAETTNGTSTHPSTPLPVVAVVDGDYMFEPLLAAAKKLRRENKIPPLLLAGIGYGNSFGSPLNKRGRDYTPSPGEEEPESGGAQPFYDHLTQHLWPQLAQHYPTGTSTRAIAGHSLGGLFALHAFFQPHPFFNSAIIGAPSIWWNNHHYLRHLSQFQKQYPAALPKNSRLFLGIGENDTESMTSDFARLEHQLSTSPFPNLQVLSQKFSTLDHYNLLPSLFLTGLETLFK